MKNRHKFWFVATAYLEKLKSDQAKKAETEMKQYLSAENDELIAHWKSENQTLQKQFKQAITDVTFIITRASNFQSFREARAFYRNTISILRKKSLEDAIQEFTQNNYQKD